MPVWKNARLRRLYGKPDDPIEAPATGSGSRTRSSKEDANAAAAKVKEAESPALATTPPPPKRVKREKTRPESEYGLVHNIPATQTEPDYSLLTKPISSEDASLIAYAVHSSRQNWLAGSMFETFWTRKPRGKKLAEGQVNLREKMTKLHDCAVTLGPHTFPVRLFAVRDDNVHLDEEADKPIEERLAKERQEKLDAENKIREAEAAALAEKEKAKREEEEAQAKPETEKSAEKNVSAEKLRVGETNKSDSMETVASDNRAEVEKDAPKTTEDDPTKKNSTTSEATKNESSIEDEIKNHKPNQQKNYRDSHQTEASPAKPPRTVEEPPEAAPNEAKSAEPDVEKTSSTAEPSNEAAAEPVNSEKSANSLNVLDKGKDTKTKPKMKQDKDDSSSESKKAASQNFQEVSETEEPSTAKIDKTFENERMRLEAEKRRNEELEKRLKPKSDVPTSLPKNTETKADTDDMSKTAEATDTDREAEKLVKEDTPDKTNIEKSKEADVKETETKDAIAKDNADASKGTKASGGKNEIGKDAINTAEKPKNPPKKRRKKTVKSDSAGAGTNVQPGSSSSGISNQGNPQDLPPEMPKTAPNQLVVYRLQQMAARDSSLSELMKLVASGNAPPDSIAKFQEVINRVKNSITMIPPAQPKLPVKRPTQQAIIKKKGDPQTKTIPGPQAATATQPVAPKPRPPVQRAPAAYHPRANAKAIMLAIEFEESPTDRYLLPKRSILEYIPEKQELLWSFLHVHKSDEPDEKDKFTPFTAIFHEIPVRIAQTLERCVRKPEVVAEYMKETIKQAERAVPWYVWYEIEKNDEVLLDMIRKMPAPFMPPPAPPRKPTKPRKPRGPTAAQLRAQQERERQEYLQKVKRGQPLDVYTSLQPVRGQPFIESPRARATRVYRPRNVDRSASALGANPAPLPVPAFGALPQFGPVHMFAPASMPAPENAAEVKQELSSDMVVDFQPAAQPAEPAFEPAVKIEEQSAAELKGNNTEEAQIHASDETDEAATAKQDDAEDTHAENAMDVDS